MTLECLASWSDDVTSYVIARQRHSNVIDCFVRTPCCIISIIYAVVLLELLPYSQFIFISTTVVIVCHAFYCDVPDRFVLLLVINWLIDNVRVITKNVRMLFRDTVKKLAHTRLPSVAFRSWFRFLAVSLQVTWVINLAVGCYYFPPGLQLPPQPLRGLLPILLLDEQRHNGCEQFA